MTPAASAGLTGGQGWHSGNVRGWESALQDIPRRVPWYLSRRKDGQVSDSRVRELQSG